jgi:hypothetical protein
MMAAAGWLGNRRRCFGQGHRVKDKARKMQHGVHLSRKRHTAMEENGRVTDALHRGVFMAVR